MNLNDNWKLPVTDEQVIAFALWAKENYGGRDQFERALSNTADRSRIEFFFADQLFSEEMSKAWWDSEKNYGDDKLQLYRRRLKIKITRTGTELARLAFPRSEDTELLSDEELRRRHTGTIYEEHYGQSRGGFVPLYRMIHYPTEADKAAFVPRACAICLSIHPMEDTCFTVCGHEFGTDCLMNWKFRTCPSCSEFCMSTIAVDVKYRL
jgi:hypothetical protein